MIRIFTLFLFITLSINGFSQAQWMWAKQVAGRNNTSGGGFLGSDNTGNLYLAGDFTDTRSFGTNSITSQGYSDVFVTKMDASGNIVWVESAGGNNATIDVRSAYTTPGGVTYLTGKFNGTVTFGSLSITASSAFDDMFVARYESDGTASLAINFGGSGSTAGFTEGRGIHADDSGNIWITGAFSSTVTFGTFTLIAGHQFNSDMFVMKMTNNVINWAERAGSVTQEDKGNAITVDAAGNVFVAGMFKQTADFGTINLSSTGVKDMFIAKYNSAGVIDWAVKAGGTSGSQNTPAAEANAIKLDPSDNIYVTGIMNGNNILFGAGISLNEIQQQGAFYGDYFVAKYNPAGVAQWARNGGGNSVTDSGNALDVDGTGNVYVTGSFQGANASFGGITLASSGIGDAFVVKYTSNGTVAWANRLGATNEDVGLSIVVDASNKAYVAGYFTGSITVGTSTLVAPSGSWEVFIARMDAGSTSVNELNKPEFTISPNPATDYILIQSKDVWQLEITDISGKIVYSANDLSEKSIHDIAAFNKGIYFITVSDSKGTATRKLVVN